MLDRFFNYLNEERKRFDLERERAMAEGASGHEIAAIDQLRQIVDDRRARWSRDLMTDRLAA